jgi:GTPase SAR1 family protein
MNNSKKIIIVGESMCGKTHFVKSLQGRQLNVYERTIGLDVDVVRKGNNIWNIWDFDGILWQDAYKNFRGASLCIIMFDSQNVNLDSIQMWYNYCKRYCPNIPIILCGTKFSGFEPRLRLNINERIFYINSMNGKNMENLVEYLKRL